MLAVVDNQLVRMTPVLAPAAYTAAIEDDHMVVRADGEKIEAGVSFHRLGDDTLNVDPRSGRIFGKGKGRIRAVFAGQHHEELMVC